MSKPEVLLWQLLRGSPAGIRFRRQYAIGPYIADFYCPAARMVIEIDGQIHDFDEQAQHDAARDQMIASFGVRIERIAASEVLQDAAGTASALIELCASVGPLHHPRKRGDGPPPFGSAAGRIR
jgi:very-short-patch-repair endonuclease